MTESYAKALFELASEENICDSVKDELEKIREIIKENPELIRILDCPGIDIKERQNVVSDCFKGANKYILNLLYILTEKCAVHLFPDLAEAYKKASGIEHITAVSAIPMTEKEIQKLELVLQKKRNKKIDLENTVDPSILGGIILRFPDSQVDASLKGRLEKAKYDLHKEKKIWLLKQMI